MPFLSIIAFIIFILSYPNGALFDIITKRGKFSEHDAISVVRQTLEGLRYLHSEGIAHRDIKVNNNNNNNNIK